MAAIVGLAGAAVTGPAEGSGTPPPLGTGGGRVCVPLPSAADCRDPDYLGVCGKRNEALCSPYNNAAFEVSFDPDPAPTQTVSYDGKDRPAKMLAASKYVTFPAGPITGTRFANALARDSSGIFAADPARSKHSSWEGSTTKIRSCGEYVWAKYYDYNRIEDAVNAYGSDYEGVYNFVMNGGSDVAPVPAIPASPNAVRTLKNREGDAMSANGITQGAHFQAKNVFFQFSPGWLLLTPEYKDTTNIAFRTYVNELLAHLQKGQSGGPFAYGAPDGWAFDRTLHSQLAPLDLSVQAQTAIEERNRRYFNLNSDLNESIAREIKDAVNHTVPINKLFPRLGGVVPNHQGAISSIIPGPANDPRPGLLQLGGAPNGPNGPNGPVVNGPTMNGAAITALDQNVNLPAQTLFNIIGLPPSGVIAPIRVPGVLTGVKYRAPTVGKGGGLSGFCTAGGCDRGALMKAIQQMLEDEWARSSDDSCLSLSNPKCDWTARSFASRFTGRFDDKRELDYARCVRITGTAGVFSSDLIKPTQVEFEANLARMEIDQREINAAIHFDHSDADPAKRNKVARGKADGDSAGWDTIGLKAGYSYDMGWELYLAKPPTTIDKSGNEVAGALCKMGALAKAIGNIYLDTPVRGRLPFFDSDSAIEFYPSGGGTYHSHTTIAGNQLYDPLGPVEFPPGGWTDDRTELYEIFKWSIPIPIGPFILTLGIGASARAGFEVGAHYTAGADNCVVSGKTLALAAVFTPKGSVEVDASLSFGVPGVDIGVEGHITVLGVGVPWTITSTITPTDISLSDDVHLEFDSLGGSVDVFAELGVWPVSKKWSKQVIAWEGLNTTTGRLFGDDLGPWHTTSMRSILE